jgi:hypothetical protein
MDHVYGSVRTENPGFGILVPFATGLLPNGISLSSFLSDGVIDSRTHERILSTRTALNSLPR